MFEKIRLKMSGSVLIFTLLLLSIALVAALSLATAVVVGTKSAGDTNKSVQAFQTADSGVEAMLQKIKNANSDDSLASIGCGSGNKATGDIRSGNSTYEVTFYDSEEPANVLDCSKKISDIAKIKSVGKFGGAIRAVETAVAAQGGNITGGCLIKWKGMGSGWTISSKWGNGCKPKGTNIAESEATGDDMCQNFQSGSFECGVIWIQDYANNYSCLCATE